MFYFTRKATSTNTNVIHITSSTRITVAETLLACEACGIRPIARRTGSLTSVFNRLVVKVRNAVYFAIGTK